MNIDPYVSRINANALLIDHAVVASRGVSQTGINTAAALVSALGSVLSDRVYNLEMPQDVAYPAAVFGHDGSEPVMVDGYHTMHVDTFIISIVAEAIDGAGGLVESVNAVRDALDASGVSIEVVDAGTTHDNETLTYATTMELELSIPVLASQTLPAAIVYPLSTSASESPYPNLTRQRVSNTFGVTLITDGSATIDDVRADLFSAMLGYQIDADHTPVEYVGGAAVDGGGKLTVWRETFTDSYYIQES